MSDHYAPPNADVLADEVTEYQPKIFSLSGRIGRIRYLAYSTLANLLIILIIGILAAIFIPLSGGSATFDNLSPVLINVGVVVFYVPVLFVYFVFLRRRLNDLNQSGWLGLLGIVPIVNLFFTIYTIFFRGTAGVNTYGPEPSDTPWYLTVLGLLLPILMIVGILAAVAIPAYQEYITAAQLSQE